MKRDAMNLRQLGEILNKMYFESSDGEAAAMVHLFGIKYAFEIKESGASMKAIAKAAGIRESYGTEISKGVKLSNFVVVK
jgi:5-methylcytosine-specific restriction protein B